MTNIVEASDSVGSMPESHFYKIFLKSDPAQFYIGSTYKLSSRKSHHKKNACKLESEQFPKQ